ncbi:MAG: Sec-independent protein translocase subunit TatA [Actinomycetaceae bacterium]|nr:Sec-independent protein translocase subunit TatA [Actinomycetaceae bacterium]
MQWWHVVIVVIVIVVVFGSAKLPEMARNLGKSAKVLKTELRELTEDETPAPTSPPATPTTSTTPPTATTPPAAPPSAIEENDGGKP